MAFLSLFVAIFTLFTTRSTAALRHSNAANKVQKRSFERHLQMDSSLSEDYFQLELILDSPMDSKSYLEKTLCKATGDLLSLTEYLGIVMNESGRKFLETRATREGIPSENIVFFVEFPYRRKLENKKGTLLSEEGSIRELQTGYVWKVKIICSLCAPDNGDRAMLRGLGSELSILWNEVAKAVQRGVRLDCKMKHLESVVFDKLHI